ncbi:uncharacterized protein EI90DRAFT_370526 [Cantharellus anzutake]|uniref:uncharacterized protein n=1 Tax=Cantharellus anzutake TaxID=1750568 RepID=UPI001903698D|nr:uncharacterized protein EI90DRAFT_370526 [Cantharellus anzutake]KAF8334868.1 hypothetical protein EI90DRAFT_370526 [Cantharellus anzutake]
MQCAPLAHAPATSILIEAGDLPTCHGRLIPCLLGFEIRVLNRYICIFPKGRISSGMAIRKAYTYCKAMCVCCYAGLMFVSPTALPGPVYLRILCCISDTIGYCPQGTLQSCPCFMRTPKLQPHCYIGYVHLVSRCPADSLLFACLSVPRSMWSIILPPSEQEFVSKLQIYGHS